MLVLVLVLALVLAQSPNYHRWNQHLHLHLELNLPLLGLALGLRPILLILRPPDRLLPARGFLPLLARAEAPAETLGAVLVVVAVVVVARLRLALALDLTLPPLHDPQAPVAGCSHRPRAEDSGCEADFCCLVVLGHRLQSHKGGRFHPPTFEDAERASDDVGGSGRPKLWA